MTPRSSRIATAGSPRLPHRLSLNAVSCGPAGMMPGASFKSQADASSASLQSGESRRLHSARVQVPAPGSEPARRSLPGRFTGRQCAEAIPLKGARDVLHLPAAELRRRMRQAVFIALGLAVGVGLVITVTAASGGVKNAQGTVLHALYGVGTDVTVTKTPKAGSFSPGSFGFGFRAGTRTRPVAGTKINDSTLAAGPTLASISSSSVATVAGLHDVAAAAGGLTLNNRTISGTMPAINVNGGGFGGGSGNGSGSGSSGGGGQSFRANSPPAASASPGWTSAVVSSARSARQAQRGPDVRRLGRVRRRRAGQRFLRDAEQLATGSSIAIGNSSGKATNFKVVGIVSEPAGDNPSDVYIPLAVAQKLAGMKSQVNTIYVAASSSSAISSVSGEISKAMPG